MLRRPLRHEAQDPHGGDRWDHARPARIVPLGEGHLRAAVRAFVEHYHEERPHQGLGNELIAPKTTSIGTDPIKCRARLGGLLKFYYREAA